jgi:Rps23 Pro-64 3,4-dihydroxylase Tpa1-like proline 4-hydroxylase
MNLTRIEIGKLIYQKLLKNKEALKKQFSESKNRIGFFYLDALLPEDLAFKIHEKFPDLKETVKKKNLREHKHTAFQMNKYQPILEELIYAFQEKEVVQIVSEICAIESILPDKHLYAGGLSLMSKDGFLNPHLDNSHDKDIKNWRVLNLLYYATPRWELENGGNLEIWPNGLNKKQLTLQSKFNRLVVMATHQESWHSVSKVNIENIRCCVSNYYFSEKPLTAIDSFHITTFRARPEEKIKNLVLQLDTSIRKVLRKIIKKGIRENPHHYKK